MVNATKNVVAFYMVACILWIVYGAARDLEPTQGTAQNFTAFIEAPGTQEDVSGKVMPWLVTLPSASSTTTTENPLMVPSHSISDKYPEDHQTTSTVSFEQTCVNFRRLVDLFDTYDDHNDVLVWMDSLAGLFGLESLAESVLQHIPIADTDFGNGSLEQLE